MLLRLGGLVFRATRPALLFLPLLFFAPVLREVLFLAPVFLAVPRFAPPVGLLLVFLAPVFSAPVLLPVPFFRAVTVSPV